MMNWFFRFAVLLLACGTIVAADTGPIPPAELIKPDHPRVLLRPAGATLAITVEQLKAIPRDAEFNAMLEQLRKEKSAAALAMVWLLTGETAAADAAVSRMRSFRAPENADSFKVYFGLKELALDYDWLYGYPGFTPEVKAEVRSNAMPLVRAGFKLSDDHVFHNYVWQSAGGLSLWATATLGEDEESVRNYAAIRERLNDRLIPGLDYLDGAPGESMWYWALYDFSPAALSVLAAQSASEKDLVSEFKSRHGDSLGRQFTHTMLCTFPDLSYTPFGDTKSGAGPDSAGPDGGVTHEMAGVLCGMTWALDSGEGAWFDKWVAGKRGLRRFYGESGVFYFLYARNLRSTPVQPPLAFLAGNKNGGHVLSRSDWGDSATVVALRATDHFGDHNHFDQGSFVIYRHGLLAVDQRVYKKVGGPQQDTAEHNALLIDGKGQRRVRGQDFRTVSDFKSNLTGKLRLETGDILFYADTNEWTAAAVQIAQAYPDGLVRSCVRQLLFVRPGTVVIVDQLEAPEGRKLGEVSWLLHAPKGGVSGADMLTVSNRQSYLRCKQLLPGNSAVSEASDLMPSCQRYSFTVRGESTLVMVHAMDVGDGVPPGAFPDAAAKAVEGGMEVRIGSKQFTFSGSPGFGITPSGH